MRLLNYVYYCSYRFFLKTSLRSYADAGPGLFLALSIWIHGMMLYYLFTLITGMELMSGTEGRLVCVLVIVFLVAAFCWYYAWKENAARVIGSFEKRGNGKKYARLGAIMLIETVLLPFIVGGYSHHQSEVNRLATTAMNSAWLRLCRTTSQVRNTPIQS
jgi:hypothetical protein